MKTDLLSPLLCGIILGALLTYPVTNEPQVEADIQPSPQVEVIVKELPEPLEVKRAPEPPPPPPKPAPAIDNVLKKIAWCESHNRQFKADGSLLRGEYNPLDVGKFQINEKYHLAESQRLGMDIHTLEGNTAYAEHLFKTQGSTPWNWSRPCWGDPNRVWTERNGEFWSE